MIMHVKLHDSFDNRIAVVSPPVGVVYHESTVASSATCGHITLDGIFLCFVNLFLWIYRLISEYAIKAHIANPIPGRLPIGMPSDCGDLRRGNWQHLDDALR
jgi:hypothetical protein